MFHLQSESNCEIFHSLLEFNTILLYLAIGAGLTVLNIVCFQFKFDLELPLFVGLFIAQVWPIPYITTNDDMDININIIININELK